MMGVIQGWHLRQGHQALVHTVFSVGVCQPEVVVVVVIP
jgi:hypothetical protein